MINRRTFLVAGAGTSAVLGANDAINIGVIGAGGRARRLLEAVNMVPGTRVVAVADVWDFSLAAARKFTVPNAFSTKRYEDLLARKDVDAVIIASPDHWHVPLTIAACQAGKDVYVEKPLTHDVSEGDKVIAAVNRSQRIVQVGTQHRSMPHLIKAREIIRSGRIGKVHKIHMTWNRNQPRHIGAYEQFNAAAVDWERFVGNARPQPFNAYRFRNWRWFWDFGGGVFTDLMVHWLDTVSWMLDLETPARATAIGDNIQAKDLWETPDTVQCLLQYPGRELQIYFEGTFVNARNAAMTELMGTEATLYIDRGRYELIPELKHAPAPKSTVAPEEMILGAGPRGADFYANPDGELLHITNWLESVRSRKRPNTPVEAGVLAAAGAHMANAALRQGRVITATG